MITYTQNDTSPNLVGDVNASLVGATVTLHLREPYTGVVTDRAATITDAGQGVWEYVWQTSELASVGVWLVEAEVHFSNGQIQTFGPSSFRVDPELG
jgi:hypothetical protein